MTISRVSSNSVYDPRRGTISDHPLPDQVRADAHFEDVGHFKTVLNFEAPPAHETRPADGHIYNSLQEILDEEAIRQIGQEAWNALPEYGKPKLGKSSKHEMRFNIASSAVNRKDITATVHETQSGTSFTARHELAHNSPLNGKRYRDADGHIIEITHAISSSQDRFGTETQMLRRISVDGRTLLYTGRPDTPHRAQQQAEWIFCKEFASAGENGKGIVRNYDFDGNPQVDAQGRPIYTFTCVVESLLSPGIYTKWKNRDEAGILQNEIDCVNGVGERVVTDPRTGREFLVKFEPVVIDSVFNLADDLMRVGPDWLFGQNRQQEITQNGLTQLFASVGTRKAAIDSSKRLTSTKKYNLKKEVDDAVAFCDRFDSYPPEKKVLAVYRLCMALNLPHIIHCMSSKDRTGICIALISAIEQHKQKYQNVPVDYEKILTTEEFKEFFAANLMAGHTMARYGRGSQGEFMGEQLEELFGLDMNANQALYRMLPERYLKHVGVEKKLLAGFAATLGLIAGCIPVIGSLVYLIICLCKGKKPDWIAAAVLFWPTILPILTHIFACVIHAGKTLYDHPSWNNFGELLYQLVIGTTLGSVNFLLVPYRLIYGTDLMLDKKADVIGKRGLAKQHEKHPFADRLKPAIAQIQSIQDPRLDEVRDRMRRNEELQLTPDEKPVFESLFAQIALGKPTFERMLNNPLLMKRLSKAQADFMRSAVRSSPELPRLITDLQKDWSLQKIQQTSDDLDQRNPEGLKFIETVRFDMKTCYQIVSDPHLQQWLRPEAPRLLQKALQIDYDQSTQNALQTLGEIDDADLSGLTAGMQAQHLTPALAQSLNPQGENAAQIASRKKTLLLQIGMQIEHFRHMAKNPELMVDLSEAKKAFVRAAVNWRFYDYKETKDAAVCLSIEQFLENAGQWDYFDSRNLMHLNGNAFRNLDDSIRFDQDAGDAPSVLHHQLERDIIGGLHFSVAGQQLFTAEEFAAIPNTEEGKAQFKAEKREALIQQVQELGLEEEQQNQILCSLHQGTLSHPTTLLESLFFNQHLLRVPKQRLGDAVPKTLRLFQEHDQWLLEGSLRYHLQEQNQPLAQPKAVPARIRIDCATGRGLISFRFVN